MDPLELLKEDAVQADGYFVNVPVMKKINIVAQAIGEERVRDELVPFLSEFIEQHDHDEAYAIIAKELGDLVPLMGGPEHIQIMLPILEKLCGEEEVSIRVNATKSLISAMNSMNKKDVSTKFLPLIKRLANGDWFTTRVSACSLFAPLYQHIDNPDKQSDLRSLYVSLCNDDTPMVRVASSEHIGEFGSQMKRDNLLEDILPIIKLFSVDDMENMRKSTVKVCLQLSKNMNESEFSQHIIPLLDSISDDQSWRVRQALANHICQFIKVQRDDILTKKMLSYYRELVEDTEAEVRIVVANQLSNICHEMKYSKSLSDITSHVFESLAHDPIPQVRIAICRQIAFALPVLTDNDVQIRVSPVIKSLAKDECVNVRWCVMEGLFPQSSSSSSSSLKSCSDESLNAQFMSLNIESIDYYKTPSFSSLINVFLPVILDLGRDRAWRVRLSVNTKSAKIFSLIGIKSWEKSFMSILISALSDHVFTVRESACEQIAKIVSIAGCDWASEKLFPTAFSIYDKSNNYLHRMTCLSMILKFNQDTKIDSTMVRTKLFPIVAQAVDDDVANVRIAAAKCLHAMMPHVNNTVHSKIISKLKDLLDDKDDDVVYYAGEALDNITGPCE